MLFMPTASAATHPHRVLLFADRRVDDRPERPALRRYRLARLSFDEPARRTDPLAPLRRARD
jgi:hypothetical protein